jgi:hypothetical protein
MSLGPEPDRFLSGRVGHVGPRRMHAMRAADLALDTVLRLRGVPARLDRLAAAVPSRSVLAACVYRPNSPRADLLPAGLGSARHDVELAFGSMGEPRPALAKLTLLDGLGGGKFENLNLLLAAARRAPAEVDWLLSVDDDVLLPPRFLDRMIGVCERLGFALAQPAQTLASHAAWPVTRRRPLAVARRTPFVEIGPVTVFRADASRELTPFPALRYGWGLDLHWAALAGERGWPLGVVDALPVRHDARAIAGAYRFEDAVAEARGFLAELPFLPSAAAHRSIASYRRLAP